MRIDIWSDVVCPWCYIGKRRLERALADFPHPVEIAWHSFQLDPGAPTEPVDTVAAYLGRKYGGGEAAGRQMVDRVEAAAAEEGMVWRHHQSLRVNTLDAHRLIHLAEAEGGLALQGALKEALLDAYFAKARNIADHEVLREIATGVGLEGSRVDAVLASDEYGDAVWADQEQASAYGASGVPFFVVDGRYAISGAQPPELFARALQQAWDAAHPVLQPVGGPGATDGADACGPDGCSIE